MAINILSEEDKNIVNKDIEEDNPDFIIGDTLLPIDGEGDNAFNIDDFETSSDFLFTSSTNVVGAIESTNELEVLKTNTVYKQRKTTDMVYMRTSPVMVDNNILNVLPKGIIVNIIDVSNNGANKWAFVNVKLLDKVLVGWINMNYLA